MGESVIAGVGPNSNVEAQVDPYHQALRASLRPMEHGAGGHYRVAARSGALTGAAVVAGAPLFSARWSDSGKLALITRLRAFLVPTVVFTAQQELGLDLMHVSGFTASDSAGTAIVPVQTRRTMPASAFTDVRVAAATLLTAGTRTLDASPIDAGGGLVNVVNAAAATAYVNPNGGGTPQFGFDFKPEMSNGEMPLVLAKDEGVLVRNTVVFPAAGTATLIFMMAWLEIPAALGAILGV